MQEIKFYALYNYRRYIYLIIVLLAASIIFQNRKNLKQWFKDRIKPIDFLLLIFLTIIIISCRLSLSFKLTWVGSSGFFVGGYILSLSILSCLVLSKAEIPLNIIFYPIYITNVAMLLLTICEAIGFDLLSTHSNLVPNDYYGFFSTLGNTNWYAGYLSIITTVSVGLYLRTYNKVHSVLLLLFITLCILNTLIIHAESLLLAYFIVFLFLIPLIINNQTYRIRITNILIALIPSLLFFSYSGLFGNLIRVLNGFYRLISYKSVSLVICILIAALIIYLRKCDRFKIKPKTIIISLIVIVSATILIMIITDPKNFGNGRGEIWAYSLIRFKDYPLKYFLIGSGPENLNSIYSAYSFENGAMLTTSHSEPLQTLLTMGILGFTFYCLIWHNIFHHIGKNIKKEECLPCALALIAYFGQSLVNSATVPNVLLLTVVVSLYFKSIYN